MGKRRVYGGVWRRDLVEREYLEDIDVEGRIILKWTGLFWLRIAQGAGCC
jgi:hypothetical protein